MTRFQRIMVTACGGDIGIGLGRIIRRAKPTGRLVGCDIHTDHAGSAFFDVCERSLPANDPVYLDCLLSLVRKHRVDLIVLGSEQELRWAYEAGVQNNLDGVPVIMVNRQTLAVGLDKLATASFLEANSLPYPWSVPVSNGFPPQLPCIVKARTGAGSKGVYVVSDQELADYYVRKYPLAIWQEYLLPDDQEYTCGLFRAKSGETRHIIFKRRLQGGFTGSGETVDHPGMACVLRRLAEGLDLCGSINVQLRLTSRGPIIFEINPRFSSTVVFRHLLGFHDLLWSIQDIGDCPLGAYASPPAGIRFYRTSQEVFCPALSLSNNQFVEEDYEDR